jgi:hypothetical protein
VRVRSSALSLVALPPSCQAPDKCPTRVMHRASRTLRYVLVRWVTTKAWSAVLACGPLPLSMPDMREIPRAFCTDFSTDHGPAETEDFSHSSR